MLKHIDVTDLPDPLVVAIESLISKYREQVVSTVQKPVAVPRPAGWMKGKIELSDTFFEPLPDDLLNAFDGHGGLKDVS